MLATISQFAFAICALLLAGVVRLAIKPYRSNLKHLPTPKQRFFLFRLLHEPTVFEIEEWFDTLPNQGLIRYFGQWNEERVLAASVPAVKDMLTVEAYKFVKPSPQRRMIANAAGARGLLLLEGDEHKATRKAMSPAFRPEQIERAYPIMWKSAYDVVNAILVAQQSTSTRSHQLLRLLNAASIDNFGNWGLSTDIQAVNNPSSPIPKTYIGILKTTPHGQKFFNWAYAVGPEVTMKLPLRIVKIIRALAKFSVDTAESVVEGREAAVKTAKPEGQEIPEDMLNMMMKSSHFSHDDMVMQTVHMIAASTETTASTLSWAVHLLSRHPDMQTRLREEIRAHLPSLSPTGKSAPKDAAFREMPYLDAVISETLRFHSPNTIIWRDAIEDARIAGTVIPKGTKTVFSPWATSRDPRVWGPDAREFNPERWVADSVKGGAESTYAFLPFGAGPRNCPGDRYARAQMRCLLAGLVGRFDFAPASPAVEGSDDGLEIGSPLPFTLFKIMDGQLKLNIREIDGW